MRYEALTERTAQRPEPLRLLGVESGLLSSEIEGEEFELLFLIHVIKISRDIPRPHRYEA